MTKLEEEIQMAIKEAIQNPKHGFEKHRGVVFTLTTVATLAAADVAKKYILKFMEDSSHSDGYKEQWLKENGII